MSLPSDGANCSTNFRADQRRGKEAYLRKSVARYLRFERVSDVPDFGDKEVVDTNMIWIRADYGREQILDGNRFWERE
jgi:hypothetical protein